MSKKKNTQAKVKKKVGRPTKYTKELAIKLCERLRDGRTATSIMNQDKDMPHRRTLFRWINNNEEFRHMYALARTDQLRLMADEMLDLAAEFEYTKSRELAFRQRNLIEVRKFLFSKIVPRSPVLRGSLQNQVNQVNDSFNNMYINHETAELLLKLITTKAQLKPIDEYGDKLKEIVDKLGKINGTRKND